VCIRVAGDIQVDLYDRRAIHISMAFTVAHKYNFWSATPTAVKIKPK